MARYVIIQGSDAFVDSDDTRLEFGRIEEAIKGAEAHAAVHFNEELLIARIVALLNSEKAILVALARINSTDKD